MVNRRSLVKMMGAAASAAVVTEALADTEAVCNSAPASGLSDDLVLLSAMELSNAIHARRVSCVEVMTAYLGQIDRLNPTFNVIVARADSQSLLEQAAARDVELSKGQSRGWMHGFPFAVKDLAHAAGFVTSMGSEIFADSIAMQDSIHIGRVKSAGAIVIGKTNVPEFGLGSQSYNGVYGVTRCAYDSSKTAGGSSGGAAAGLALRMLPVADGSDMMGSLRNPGAFNNVIGFRPTPGVVPLGNSFQETLACNGPMGRNVSDTARLLATIAGPHTDDPNTLPIDPDQFKAKLAADWHGKKIGWLGDFDGYLPTEPGVMEICTQGLSSFRDIGCEVDAVIVDFSMSELWQVWLTYRHWMNRGRGISFYADPEQRKYLKPEFIWEIEGGASITGDDVSKAITARARWYKALSDLFETYDALVWPTAQVFPFDAETHWPNTVAGKSMDTYHRWMETVVPGTMAGCPVINVPAGFSQQGLPMGLQVMLPRHRDFRALQLAYAYEQASCWNLSRVPSVV